METEAIRRELTIRRTELISQGMNPNNALNEARKEMNIKYGKGWREQDIFKSKGKISEPSVYEDHENGEHWVD